MKSIHRFFVEEIKERYEDKELVHQLRDVFRMGKGDEIVLFRGDGYEHLAKIELLTKKEATFVLGDKVKKEEEKGINLFISIIKKSNFELAIEKAVELGVSSITPVKANRSQYDILNKERLQKIIKEATEQSGRVTLPEIRDTLTTKEVISENPEIIIFDMEGESIKNAPKADSILIGPEGGWSDEERKMFDKTYSVSKNTLRAETAVIAGLVSIMLV